MIMGASMTSRDIIFTRDAYGTAGSRGRSSFSNNYFRESGSFIAPVPGGCTNPNFYVDGGRCRFDFRQFERDVLLLTALGEAQLLLERMLQGVRDTAQVTAVRPWT